MRVGRVARRGDHEIVGDACRQRGLEKGAVLKRTVGLDAMNGEALVAPGVHVEVDAAVVVQDKVANGVGALDGEDIVVPDVDEPWILGGDESARRLVSPKL